MSELANILVAMKIIREIVEFKTFANHSVVWRSITKRDNAQKFPWNQLFSNFFSKNVNLTKKSWIFRKNRDHVL